MNKAIIFDASTLISFAMNGLLPEFKELKKIFKGHFIITKQVKHEIIDKPLTIKRFELEALKLKQLLEDKILELPSVTGVNDQEISKKTKQIFEMANNTFQGRKRPIHLIDSGECSCLALSEILNKRKIKNVISVDERTTRSLAEKPEELRKFLEKKLHTRIIPKKQNYKFFKQFKIIRSTELIYMAYKKGLVKLKHKNVLDALLWAMKFKGCSISHDEIKEIKRLG